nr:aspartate aminotransferase, cytoplasmic [Pelodiscus sinensis]|eukprot:XP_025045887.1 aspartate aminotransferase, cytoplasmic [Pelodiscus sinensis]
MEAPSRKEKIVSPALPRFSVSVFSVTLIQDAATRSQLVERAAEGEDDALLSPWAPGRQRSHHRRDGSCPHNRSSSGPVAVYVALPQWDSLRCIFQDVGFTELRSYHYWDTARLAVAAEEFLQVLESAPEGSIVMLHAPEETGLTPKQWEDVARVMGKKRLFPFFDVPAQGLASGDLDRDAWALRHFVAQGFELLCAQSFSKTFGLYDERVGNLIVVARDSGSLVRICSQLQEQVRATWASPTSLGARVIATVLSNPALRNKWKQSLRALVEKILLIREKLKAKLRLLGTPGCWEHLTAQVGTRSFTGLLPSQVAFLERSHIYLRPDGQFSLCSINAHNLDYVARSIHEAVCGSVWPVQGGDGAGAACPATWDSDRPPHPSFWLPTCPAVPRCLSKVNRRAVGSSPRSGLSAPVSLALSWVT